MVRSLPFVTAFTALILSTVPGLHAAETVWSGLVIAENVAQPESIPPELTRIERLLKDLFGYNQFQVIGQSSKTLKTGQEDWLATSKFFGLRVDARGKRSWLCFEPEIVQGERAFARNRRQVEQAESARD